MSEVETEVLHGAVGVPSILSLIEIGGAACSQAAAADVAHGALPYIGGARLAPGQLSFATLATAASHRLGGTQHCSSSSSDDDDDLQVDGFGKGARRTARAHARTRLLLRPEERLLGIALPGLSLFE